IYANSITLTPGTVTTSLSGDSLEVHALTREGADELLAGDMDRRVAGLERGTP
ncbi:MAG TPA: Na+/H+ antiporter subunit E, partial [Candidatus Competibacter sp.]|nr:Na+/H+ antiporter subunit E [Candidatus Competibacter sp.]